MNFNRSYQEFYNPIHLNILLNKITNIIISNIIIIKYDLLKH